MINEIRQKGAIYAHMVDSNMTFVQIRNDSDDPLIVQRHARLGMVNDLEEEGCYAVTSEDHGFAGLDTFSKDKMGFKPSTTDPDCSMVLPNGITIYGIKDSPQVAALEKVCNDFPDIWKDLGKTVNIPEDEHLQIPLMEGWEKHKIPSKIYDLSQKDRELVDKTFDELHEQGRMSWTKHPTPFGFPVFVVWRPARKNGQIYRKGRAVVDIRGLNMITLPDSYPLPLQGEIISSVRGCYYITTVDAASFFYQWLVAMRDRYKLPVISHRGQEYFNVAPMGFKNSPPYVQRQMDRILREFRAFCRTYIDDIDIFSVTSEDHVKHLTVTKHSTIITREYH